MSVFSFGGEANLDLKHTRETGSRYLKGRKNTYNTDHSTVIGQSTDRLKISQQAIDKIIADVLGGADGLASRFQGEQTAGIYSSSVAAQAAGDLTANLVGEIAKLTAEREQKTADVGIELKREHQDIKEVEKQKKSTQEIDFRNKFKFGFGV